MSQSLVGCQGPVVQNVLLHTVFQGPRLLSSHGSTLLLVLGVVSNQVFGGR